MRLVSVLLTINRPSSLSHFLLFPIVPPVGCCLPVFAQFGFVFCLFSAVFLSPSFTLLCEQLSDGSPETGLHSPDPKIATASTECKATIEGLNGKMSV